MDDIEGDGKNGINKITGSETLENRECLVSEDFVSMKRSRYAETESIPEKTVKKMFCSQSGKNTADESMIVKLIKESNYSIGKKIQASEQKIIETIHSCRNIPVNTCQSKVNQTKTSDKISRGDLADCKDLDNLVRYLEQNKFTYDEESGNNFVHNLHRLRKNFKEMLTKKIQDILKLI